MSICVFHVYHLQFSDFQLVWNCWNCCAATRFFLLLTGMGVDKGHVGNLRHGAERQLELGPGKLIQLQGWPQRE